MWSKGRGQLEALMSLTEEMWGHWDTLFSSLEGKGWEQKHGQDWIFADVPYHLAYCERELVAYPIQQGPDIPEDRRVEIRTMGQLNQWNDSWFAKRPPSQTVDESMAQLEASRDAVRQAVVALTDADLKRRCWFPAIDLRGWRPVRRLLDWNLLHNLNEFLVLRYYMKRDKPAPSPEWAHRATVLMTRRMEAAISARPAIPERFAFTLEFIDRGAGTWTFRIANEEVERIEGEAANADIVMTTSLAMFFEIVSQKISTQQALIAGKIEIAGQRHVGTLARLIEPPGTDEIIEPLA